MDQLAQLGIGLCMGIALAAATGFRIFVPLLVLSIASHGEHPMIHLSESFQWIGSPVAIAIFGSATAVEIAGYYVPWVDNLLDTIATPAAVVAGIVATAAALGDTDPALKWTLAVIAGGGVATSVQLLTVATRATSTATTGGVGNPVVSTVEAAGSILISILALIIPVIIGILVILVIAWLIRRIFRRRRAKRLQAAVSTPAGE